MTTNQELSPVKGNSKVVFLIEFYREFLIDKINLSFKVKNLKLLIMHFYDIKM